MKKLALISGLLLSSACNAATNSTTFTITGTVSGSCSLNIANVTLPGDLSTIQTGNTNLNVQCTNALPYNLSVTSTNSWTLVNGASPTLSPITYALTYTGTNNNINKTWSGGAAGTVVTNPFLVGTGTPQQYPLQVTTTAPGANVTAGTYSDTVTVNVIY